MEDELKEFLRSRSVPEDVINRMTTEKVGYSSYIRSPMYLFV